MLDVRDGDVLALGGQDYPIRSCEPWPWPQNVRGVVPFTDAAATVKRSPGVVGGKRGAPATHLEAVRCTALYPASAEIRQRPDLQTPHTLLQAYLDGGDTVYALVVEDLKR
jgi:hypothetical protein